MASRRRIDLEGILADPDLRRKLMVPAIQAAQAREGIETTREQAERAYYVVTEGERVAFFDLQRFRGARDEPDRREAIFERALRYEAERVRFDVALRDFGTIEGSPIAYRSVGILAPLFDDFPPAESLAEAHQGVIARPDEPYIRQFWEVAPRRDYRPWVTLHKGGDFSRFYFDADLVIDWSDSARRSFHRLRDPKIYFKSGLTWPRRTQKGFNVRRLPAGCVFSDKGPSIFFRNPEHENLFLAVANSELAEFIMDALMTFGSWELTAIRRFPLALGSSETRRRLGNLAGAIHDTKAGWDEGNETSTRFSTPWLTNPKYLGDLSIDRISTRLERLAEAEVAEEARIQRSYAELNDEVYRLYGIPERTRGVIEETLGKRPPEVLWPHMEGKTREQKRMEHVFRLLSYVVKCVLEADEDGIASFASVAGEPSLLERVHLELQTLFPHHDAGQVEIEITNELKKNIRGYRRTASIGEWLANAFFEYHCGLYKSRPILWHIASGQGAGAFAFGALVHYHRFDKNRMGKLRGQYLRDAIETFRREAALADKARRTDQRLEWQGRLEEAQELDRRLQWVQEGHHEGQEGGDRDYRILMPWKSPNDRSKGWDPHIDDGVKVNIEPLQKAGVLRVTKVV